MSIERSIIMKIRESKLDSVKKSLEDAGIEYSVRGINKDQLVVSKKDLKRASEIRDEIDPGYSVKILSHA